MLLSRIFRANLIKALAPAFRRTLTIQHPQIQPPKVPIFWIVPNIYIYKPKYEKIELPRLLKPPMEAPSSETIPKLAVKMIVIRRKKMKRHKLRKLKRKMKHEWAKIKQKREMRKEKTFQAELVKQSNHAENFSAAAHVDEKLKKLHTVIPPRYWKGKRLPQFLIKLKMGLQS